MDDIGMISRTSELHTLGPAYCCLSLWRQQIASLGPRPIGARRIGSSDVQQQEARRDNKEEEADGRE
jgi:hypothetical protein